MLRRYPLNLYGLVVLTLNVLFENVGWYMNSKTETVNKSSLLMAASQLEWWKKSQSYVDKNSLLYLGGGSGV